MAVLATLGTASAAHAETVKELIDEAKCPQTELLNGATLSDQAASITGNYKGPFVPNAVKVCIVRKQEDGRTLVSAVDYIDSPQMPTMVRYLADAATMFVGEFAQPKNYEHSNAKPVASCAKKPTGLRCSGNPRVGSPFSLLASYAYRSEPPKYSVQFVPGDAVGPYKDFATVAGGTRPRVVTQKGAIELKGYEDPEHTSKRFVSTEQDTRKLIAYAQQVPGNTPIEYQIDAILEGKAVAIGRAVKSDAAAVMLLFQGMENMAKRLVVPNP